MRRVASIFVFLCSSLFIFAQKPEQLLDELSQKSPIEKIYLHFDRENYVAGETAWFKAYTTSDYLPDTISTSLYVELLNADGMVLLRSVSPILLGTATGQLEIPDTLGTSTYSVRAFTSTILNHASAFIPVQRLSIYGRKSLQDNMKPAKKIQINFFPEAGNFVTGTSNTLAFKAIDEWGMPAFVTGKVVNDKHEIRAIFSAYHDGMGMFEISPASNELLFAVLDGDDTQQKFSLPVPDSKAPAITVIPHPQGSFFEITQRTHDPSFQVAYMIGQMQHHVVFKQEFKNATEKLQGVINTKNLHSGIMQVSFFNKYDQPLGERLCFVNNREYILPGELKLDTLNFGFKAKNRFSVKLTDTIRGSFSISVTDAAYHSTSQRPGNIITSLLLTADLKGYIHNPAFYFAGNNDSVNTALDLLMMTNGWRRFKWSQLSSLASQPVSHADGAFITLKGNITLRDAKKSFASKPALLMLIAEDSSRHVQLINTDKDGNFKLDSMLFFGRSKIIFSDIRGKKNQFIDVHLSGDSLQKNFVLSPPEKLFRKNASSQDPEKMTQYLADFSKGKGLLLEAVTVKTKKKNLIAELDEKYTKGLFSGDGKTIDLVNNTDAENYQNIFDYLQFKVPGLQISNDGFDYQVYYRQNGLISSLGNPQMTIFLDEIETDAAVVATIPPAQIAMLKIYSSFAGATGNAMGGVLAIYTKKGADLNDLMQNAADIVNYNGYSITKEFYAPDYSLPASRSADDKRITLDWRPNIIVNSVNPSLPFSFYNNDSTNSYRIVVEGMTVEGKMLMIEKIVTRERKGF